MRIKWFEKTLALKQLGIWLGSDCHNLHRIFWIIIQIAALSNTQIHNSSTTSWNVSSKHGGYDILQAKS